MNNMGNQTIFSSLHDEYDKCYNKCCFIIEDESKCRIKNNSIYFFTLAHLYICNLKDQSISMSLPCPTVSRYYSFKDIVF